MLPSTPTLPPPVEPLPAELQAEVDQSVKAFEEKLGMLRHWPIATEWLAEYRDEVTRMIWLGLKRGAAA